MKHIITWVLVVVWAATGVSQIPLPSVRYTEENFHALELFSGQRSTNKLEIQTDQNTGQQMTHLQDAASREFIVEEAVIDPGFSYDPASGSEGVFQILTGNRSDMEGVWFEPINYFPQLYEKIEWGVKLPDEVEAAIDNWIWNDQHPTEPPLTPALNPFDPEQIDLQSHIEYTTVNGWTFSQTVYGFFYRHFERIYEDNNPDNLDDMDDPDNWFRKDNNTPYRFRFRWASTVISHHSVRIILNVPSMGQWEMEPFEFDSYWGDPSKSFVGLSQNNRYFMTDDGQVFFPVGQNLFPAQCGRNTPFLPGRSVSNYTANIACDDCYPPGAADPCCGLDEYPDTEGPPDDWRHAFWRGERSTIELATEHIAA